MVPWAISGVNPTLVVVPEKKQRTLSFLFLNFFGIFSGVHGPSRHLISLTCARKRNVFFKTPRVPMEIIYIVLFRSCVSCFLLQLGTQRSFPSYFFPQWFSNMMQIQHNIMLINAICKCSCIQTPTPSIVLVSPVPSQSLPFLCFLRLSCFMAANYSRTFCLSCSSEFWLCYLARICPLALAQGESLRSQKQNEWMFA